MLITETLYQNIIFDLDGTLTNPGKGICNAIKYALAKMNNSTVDFELNRFIGPPLHISFENFFKDPGQIDEAVSYFREYYGKEGWSENEPYEGIADLLSELRTKGIKIFLATNKPQLFADKILKHFDLHHYFEAVKGVDLSGGVSSKNELISSIFVENTFLNGRNTIMVGDSIYDILPGNEFELQTISVSYGFGKQDELEKLMPKKIVHSVKELSETLLSDA